MIIIKKYWIIYSLLFLVFGSVVAAVTSFIYYKAGTGKIYSDIKVAEKLELKLKKQTAASYIAMINDSVYSVRNNRLFKEYINNKNEMTKNRAASVLTAVSNTHFNFIQVRYIDKNGKEIIRIDKKVGTKEAIRIPENKLQDKSLRYYFLAASNLDDQQLWISRIDLNIENGKIEKPYKPVLRVATPVYHNGLFEGIVIINVSMKSILYSLTTSSYFDIYLVDNKGFFMVHPNMKNNWSRYLNQNFSLLNEMPEIHNNMSQEKTQIGKTIFISPMSDIISNRDKPYLIFRAKTDVLQSMRNEIQSAAVKEFIIILILAFPVALIMARIPSELSNQLSRKNVIMEEYIDIIDENVIVSVTDKNGIIKQVSTEFLKVSGYKKEQLIGHKHNVVRHPETEDRIYKELWSTINRGEKWKGELKDLNASGDTYWLETTILPKVDSNGDVIEFTAVQNDITDKKKIEELSITDELTGLYNRRYFNEIFSNELKRAKRNSDYFGFVIMDIDYFKRYNDTYGHPAGDTVLKKIGTSLKESLTRSSDYCFRLGGEEFGIIFTNTDKEQAGSFMEMVRASIEELHIEHSGNECSKYITISIGFVCTIPRLEVTESEIYSYADESLYEAKKSGRNRVAVSDKL